MKPLFSHRLFFFFSIIFLSPLSAGNFYRFFSEEKRQESFEHKKKLAESKLDHDISYSITLKTADGLTRKGVLTLRKNAKGNMVLCHPAAYDKNFLKPFEEQIFHEYNCIRFDFRRHGEISDKQYATLGKKEVYEVDAAVNAFKNHPQTKNLPLFGFGISMGAVTLIQTQSMYNYFAGLIVQAPFESLRKQAQRTFKFFRYPLMGSFVYSYPAKLYAKRNYRVKLHRINPITSIKKIKNPVFLIHAYDDPMVSIKAFERFKQVGKCITKTWAPKTGRHTELFKMHTKTYIKKCLSFLRKTTSKIKEKIQQKTGFKKA